jgi:hypothetical protein
MTHDELVTALRAVLDAEGVQAPVAPVKPGDAVQCPACSLRHVATADGLCPNNNCPRHYRSYPAYRAATGQVIADLEADGA